MCAWVSESCAERNCAGNPTPICQERAEDRSRGPVRCIPDENGACDGLLTCLPQGNLSCAEPEDGQCSGEARCACEGQWVCGDRPCVDLERGGFECQDNEQPNDNEEQETMTQMLEATVCEPVIFENDPFSIRSAVIENGVLNVSAEYGLGCFDAVFIPCAGDFMDGRPFGSSQLFADLQNMDGEQCDVDIAGNANLAIDGVD